jgi:hypothetical protein
MVIALASGITALGQSSTNATWRVQKYDLKVSQADRSIVVKANLSVKNVSGRAANTLTLRISPAAEVGAIHLNGEKVEAVKSEEKINAATNLQRLAIRFPSAAANAVVSVAVDYKLNVKDNSALATISPAGVQFLPLSFWYPTPNSWFFTKGADAAPFSLSLSRGTMGSGIVSAGTEKAIDSTNSGHDLVVNGKPFFITGDWQRKEAGGVTVHMPKGADAEGEKRAAELASLASEARTFTAGLLGKAPDVPLRIVASRRGNGFADAGTMIVDEAVFRRSKIDSQTAINIAEGVIKTWLGGSTSVTGDGYGVISEGLSRYIATQFIESRYGKDVADIERLRQRTSYAAVSRRDSPLGTVSPLDDFYYPAVANKGAMVWRILARRFGSNEFWPIVRANMEDGDLNVAELRSAFSSEKVLLDSLFDNVTDMDLRVGLPQPGNGETKVAVQNTGTSDVTVDLVATTASGEKIVSPTTIRAKNFGAVTFRTPGKIVRVEIDPEKLYPQTDYSDDVKPAESGDSDPMVTVKRLFDKQDFAAAEAAAKTVLRDMPRFDDLRVLLGRSLLAQNKNAEAEREFRAVLDERLPTARSLAWANVGLAETAARSNQNPAALTYAETAIASDAEYGASLAARNLRNKLNPSGTVDPSIKQFFADFDKAAASNRKAEVEAMVIAGEMTKFTGGVSGSTETWATQVRHVDRLDASTVLAEAAMTIKLLNRNEETGLAVFRLVRSGASWKLAAVDMFEVR